LDNGSCMSGDAHVQFCEQHRGKFLVLTLPPSGILAMTEESRVSRYSIKCLANYEWDDDGELKNRRK